MPPADEPNQNALQMAAYTLSRARIAEQVIINVLSALAIGSLAAVGSLLLLLYQHIAHYIVVPTNVLMAIVFVGLGAVIMLVLVTIAAYLAIGIAICRSNAVLWGAMLGLWRRPSAQASPRKRPRFALWASVRPEARYFAGPAQPTLQRVVAVVRVFEITGQQRRRRIQVGHADHLVDGMHIARRNRDGDGRRATLGALHRSGVCATTRQHL